MRRGVLGVVFGGLAVVCSMGLLAGDHPFSRSEWIAERMDRMPFSGGVLPAGTRPRLPVLPRAEPGTSEAGPASIVRVNKEILAPDSGTAQLDTQTEPHLAINLGRENNLIAGYQDNRYESGGARALGYAYSVNGGRTWTSALVPGLTLATGGKYERASDPWVAFGTDNRAHYASLAFNESLQSNGVYVSTSTDGGRTFGPPVTVHFNTNFFFDDKEAMVVDTGEESPYKGTIYVGWDTTPSNFYQIMYMSRSTDDGRRFSTAVPIYSSGYNVGIVPLVGPDGTVYAIWTNWRRAGTYLVCARSTDGGQTWTPPVDIAPVDMIDLPGLRTGAGLPMAAIDPSTSAIYVVWLDPYSYGGGQIVMSRSFDRGQTWSAPVRISDGPATVDNFTPAVAVNGRGQVAVSYYSRRNNPPGTGRHLVDEYLAISDDGGETFGAGTRITPTSFDIRYAAVSRGYFLGDYQGLAGGKELFHLLWVSTLRTARSDSSRKQPDAYASRVSP